MDDGDVDRTGEELVPTWRLFGVRFENEWWWYSTL